MFSNLLNSLRKLRSQVEFIKTIDMPEEERRSVDDAILDLKDALLKADSAIADFKEANNVLSSKLEILKDLNLSEGNKKNLITSIEKLKEITDKI